MDRNALEADAENLEHERHAGRRQRAVDDPGPRPRGVVERRGNGGLPFGIQAARRPGDEEMLLSFAAQMEKLSGWLKRRALLKVPA